MDKLFRFIRDNLKWDVNDFRFVYFKEIVAKKKKEKINLASFSISAIQA